MSIRPNARRWFLSKYGNTKSKTYTSKYYLPEESWPKVAVWWLQISNNAIDENKDTFINILCETEPSSNDFYYLKVPVDFIKEHKEKFHKIGDKIDWYLSADPDTLFREIRGEGKLNFSAFLV
jgi:hypothetical protein